MLENAIRGASPRYYNGWTVRDNVNHTISSERGSLETLDVNALPLSMTARSLIRGSRTVSIILQLLRPRLSASISLKAPPLPEHPASARDVPRALPASSRHVVHAGLAHEVTEARALDTMVARRRERKRSRGSHGEVITETKHGPCEQSSGEPDTSALRHTEISR